jgi:tripartite-type tricarboxylate transporter receptor subunit TctC
MSTLLNWIDATRVALAVFAAFAGAAAASDDYPNRPIRVIVPAAPGVGLDLDARPIAQKIGEILQQSIVIENRPRQAGSSP